MSRFLRYEQCGRCAEQGRDNRGDNLAIYDDGGAHCFSCGFHSFPKHYRVPSREAHVNEPKSLLPLDFTKEVPAYAWQWLLQYGLPYSYWKEHVGFSPKENRLVFRVGMPMAFSIGRYVGTEPRDKNHRKWYVWGNSHQHCERIGAGPVTILVEDLISAHKVAAAGVEAIPLFGTKVHPSTLYYLMTIKKPVYMWLDKDQEGNVKKQAINLQVLTDNPVDVIITDQDPKCYTTEQIKEIVNEHNP